MHNGVDHNGSAHQTEESAHAHLHTHTGEHAHQHEGLSPETVHTHEHMHTHELDCVGDQAHQYDPATSANRAEIVALLTYTLQHNHHHNEELLQMQAQLRALGLDAEAELLGSSISDFTAGNARLADILKTLQE